MLRRNIARFSAGDPEPLLRGFAADVHFVFPGESTWKADVRGKEEVERWERRYLDTGLHMECGEILVTGPPWRTLVALRFRDYLVAPTGELVHENEGVVYGTIVWGKVTTYTVYEDTQKLGPLDEYLALQEALTG
jgi:ketosteroid isomerase-like protein